jgi:membrane protease YdiL (CAAX protease family)
MDSGAIDIKEVLVPAALALVFGYFWHWMGWFQWPTEPARKPLGRMTSFDAPIAVGVYLLSVTLTVMFWEAFLKPGSVAATMPATMPSTVPATFPTTAPGGESVSGPSLVNHFLLSLVSVVPIAAYFLFRCFPRTEDADRQTGFETKGFWKLALAGVAVGVTVLPLILLLNVGMVEVAYRLFDVPRPTDGHDLLQMLRVDPSPMNYIMVSLMAVLVAPVSEELLFRGIMLGSLREIGRGPAVFISAGLFALVHVGGVPWQVLPALAFLGVVLGLLFEKTGVLWPNIFAHAAFNASNVLLSLLYVNKGP